MRVLVADMDRKFCGILDRLLRAEGVDLVCVHSVQAAATELGQAPFHALVCGLELPVGGAEALRRHLPELPPTVLTSSRAPADQRVQEARESLGARHYFRKPFPLFDLVDVLRTWDPGPGAGEEPARPSAESEATVPSSPTLPSGSSLGRSQAAPPAAEAERTSGSHRGDGRPRPQGQDASLLLAKVWAERLSGRLTVVGEGDRSQGTVDFEEGGPTSSAAWPTLRSLLSGGRARWQSRDIGGTGDWTGMGTLLAECLREPGRTDFAGRFGKRLLVTTPRAAAIPALPLSLGVRSILQRAGEPLPLMEVIEEVGLRPQDVSVELHLLYRLGVIRLVNAPGGSSRSLSVSRDPSRLSADGSSISMTRSSSGQRPRWRDLAPSQAARGTDHEISDLRTQVSGSASETSDGSHSSVWSVRRSRSARRRAVRTGAETFKALSQRLGRRAGAGQQSSERQLERLKRELSSMRGSRPHVILAIPQDSDVAMVEKGWQRMTPRYAALSDDLEALPEARTIAGQILELVDAAYADMLQVAQARESVQEKLVTPDGVTDVRGVARDAREEDRLLAMGREYLRQKAWQQADHAFSQAKKLVFHDPDILSGLAWARFHNDRYDPSERLQEARDLLLLVETLEPKHADCQRYLAHVLYSEGRFKSARVRARRALKLSPEDDGLRQLLRQIERQLDE